MAEVATPTVYKQSGKPQRVDVLLSKEIATALSRKVRAGEPLFTSQGAVGELELILEGGEVLAIQRNTINAWITRGNVVPETGEPLREILDKAREGFRNSQREKRQKALVDMAEQKMTRTMNLRTTVPIRNMFGQIVKNEDGSVARRENHNVLRIQMDTAKFVTERLDPARYGKVEKTENKHLVFSLADLRRAERGGEVQ